MGDVGAARAEVTGVGSDGQVTGAKVGSRPAALGRGLAQGTGGVDTGDRDGANGADKAGGGTQGTGTQAEGTDVVGRCGAQACIDGWEADHGGVARAEGMDCGAGAGVVGVVCKVGTSAAGSMDIGMAGAGARGRLEASTGSIGVGAGRGQITGATGGIDKA